MSKQLIFCVESDNKAKTDWVYIRETINRFFAVGNDIKLSPVYMAGKTNYKKNKVVSEIRKLSRSYPGESVVIYCIDTDALESNRDRQKEFDAISKYCKDSGYELIWFHRDIEEVYTGSQAEDSSKKALATSFKTKNMISSVETSRLSSKNANAGKSSNILSVLSKHLK